MSILDLSSFDKRERTRYGAYAYLRVSDPSQAERRASLSQQERQIRAHLEKLEIPILKWFKDEGKSAFKDQDNRDDFWRMIKEAKEDTRCGFIVVDDESRFFRNKYETAKVKGALAEYGISTMTTTRYLDSRTVAGLWQESIEETAAQADSIMRSQYTLRGMKGNVHERDPESGWAFKNGPAPFGWKPIRIHLGNDSMGRPIDRTIWEIDEEWAKIRRQILMRRKEGWSYDQIRDELNQSGIRTVRGSLWSTSTIHTACREDMVWTAAGYGIWNKHYRRGKTKGQNFKPVDDWEIEPNAHPAIISEGDARAIIEVGRERRRTWRETRGNHTRGVYLLSGPNFEGEPLFVCVKCGGKMIGTKGGRARRKYICSTYSHKGRSGCIPFRVDKENLEERVLDYIQRVLLTEEYVREVLKAANEAAKKEVDEPKTGAEEKELKDVIRQQDQIKKAILAGTDPTVWADELTALQQRKVALEAAIANRKRSKAAYRPVDENEAPEILKRLTEAFRRTGEDNQRRFIRSFVRQVALDPDTRRIMVEYLPNPKSPYHPVALMFGVGSDGGMSSADSTPRWGYHFDARQDSFSVDEIYRW